MNDAAQAAGPAEGDSAGAMMRRAREAAGLHIATLAVSLKVPVRKLEALEEDRYDQLSDAVFVRALASSVCRTLKIDPQPVLERLPQGAKPRLVQTGDGINEPFRAPGDGPSQTWTDQLSRPVVLAVVALLVGSLVILFLPTMRRDDAQAVRTAQGPKPSSAQTAPVPPPEAAAPSLAPAAGASAATPLPAQPAAATPSNASPSPAPSTVAAAPAAAMPPANGASVASVPMPVQPASAAPSSSASSSASALQAAASGVVVFRAHSQSWVEVRDANGTTVLRRLMEAGETAGASGSLPLKVIVGSAPATDVLVRGKPYDTTPVTRDNVARFEVN
ncbi:MAG TPA: helix-turn-helix domain-containing protein [Ramlibacter sp.]|uniref:helix-turn-helix domain-containing protein n=1 Tax=Ramlibacter sp. TaxID=1917967 RepID=UPI002CEB2036|nr:helix-turn-helix domain-containing protein [Ramlibacter sp.]HVZ43046.1 helix-turn-helix domain-containing protein [Ramlibacter sp.]